MSAYTFIAEETSFQRRMISVDYYQSVFLANNNVRMQFQSKKIYKMFSEDNLYF